ncbi:hypothetical protein K443DRAFT_672258 [Laccaria amethystina LaAM-08-1]|uniref:Uncharacterized protein n=1 Tax=Laccaria amethystina LaAM-08-1 TaxID=1095629 RepID=A0A0C9Y475_9AGAR|nr:hypothetical protein K443DRAFT_672258 [Laccaria amethystina LaAM-08-1]
MKNSISFERVRAIAFGCIMFLSFVWITLLSVCVFILWDNLDRPERSFLAVVLLTNTVTVIMLLILLLRKFRVWLDAARCVLLLVIHIGSAGAFAYWSPEFGYTAESPEQEASCRMITLSVMITSWFVPALVLFYSGGLAFFAHRRSLLRTIQEAEEAEKVWAQEEAKDQYFSPLSPATTNWDRRASPLSPIAPAAMNWDRRATLLPSPATIGFPPEAVLYIQQHSRNSFKSIYRNSQLRTYAVPELQPVPPTPTSSRLSKPVPLRMSYHQSHMY